MAKIIFTSRYTRAGNKSVGRKNYINYIGTRENVDKIDLYKTFEATIRQEEFIQQLMNDYKDAKELLEYEDYKNNPTIKNASELINTLLERVTEAGDDRETYIKYIAKRPRVEKIHTHGLFSREGVVNDLNKKAKEISEHKGIVWSHVLSLRREDAERLGYNNYEIYQKLVDENLIHIAKAHKIKIDNLQYVCAFHNQSHHPHIHLVVYSKDIKEGYLTEHGIEFMRSKFANSIFKDEMYYNFNEQNQVRDKLRGMSKDEVNKILEDIQQGDFSNERILLLVKELHKRLKNHKGSKSYKWFMKSGNEEVKNLIDELTKEISKDENISKLYEDWYRAKENNLRIYRNIMPERVPLYDNETFRPIQNHIIKEVLNLDFENLNNNVVVKASYEENYYESEDEQEANWKVYEEMASQYPNEFYEGDVVEIPQSEFGDAVYNEYENSYSEFENANDKSVSEKLYVKWSKKYKEARELLYQDKNDSGNVKVAYEILLKEAKKGNVLGSYDVALLNKNEVVIDETIDIDLYFNKALNGFKTLIYEEKAQKKLDNDNIKKPKKNMESYYEYRIGKMYSLGYGTEQDYEEAVDWFQKSSDKGNQYAQFSLGNCYYYGTGVEVDYNEAFKYYKFSADKENIFANYKLGEMYYKGVGTEINEEKSYSCYEKAFNGFNKIVDQDIDGSIHLKIATMYEKGLGTKINLLKSEEFYIKAMKYTKEMPKYKLGKLYLSNDYKKVVEPEQLKEKLLVGIKYLDELVEEDSKYSTSAFTLGNTFFYGVDQYIEVDYEKAIYYFNKSSEQGNGFASFKLGQMYKEGLGIEVDEEKANYYYKKAFDSFIEMLDQDTDGSMNVKIGTMYEKGQGVEIDLLKAEEHYKKALEHNSDMARYKLGNLYLSKLYKEVVSQEQLVEKIKLGVECLEKLFEEENAMSKYATCTLGSAYAFNKDLGIDIEKAKKYLHKSVELGNEYAIKVLEYIEEFEHNLYVQGYKSILGKVGGLIARNRNQENENYESKKGREVDRKLIRKIAEKKREQGIKY